MPYGRPFLFLCAPCLCVALALMLFGALPFLLTLAQDREHWNSGNTSDDAANNNLFTRNLLFAGHALSVAVFWAVPASAVALCLGACCWCCWENPSRRTSNRARYPD